MNAPEPAQHAKTGDVTIRRAWFVYESARLAALAANAPIVPEPWIEREEAFRTQFLEVIERQTGPQRSSSPEELHGSWMQAYVAMGWKYGPERDPDAKTHPDLVPYNQLGQLERDKDAVFVALCEITRQWLRRPGPAQARLPLRVRRTDGIDGDGTRRREVAE